MQYRLAILAFAGLAAAESSSSSAAGAQSTNGVTSQQSQCLSACASGDVDCQAQCVNVPYPNQSQVNANLECARNCNQGDGSPEQTVAYGNCLAKCASQHYFTNSGTLAAGSGTAPTAVPASGAAASSGSDASSTGTGAGAANTDASMSSGSGMSGGNSQTTGSDQGGAQATGSNTSSQSSSTSHGGAVATLMPVGLMGMAMAVLAL